jgi:hypothetical protein
MSVKGSKIKGIHNLIRSHNYMNITAVVRIRPPIEEDYRHYLSKSEFDVSPIVHSDKKGLSLISRYFRPKSFLVDRVLTMDTTQHEMYEEVGKDIVKVKKKVP